MIDFNKKQHLAIIVFEQIFFNYKTCRKIIANLALKTVKSQSV